jgi:hypothetical protein
MWNAFVQRRNGGGYDDERSLLELIELNDDDCKLLIRAGLKIQKGASPRDLYCFQNLPSFYDGTPLQVLRLLEEMRSAGRKRVRKADAASHTVHETTPSKRQRVASLAPSWAKGDGLLEISESEQLPDVVTIRSVSAKQIPSPAKGADLYETIASPVKPSSENAARRGRRSSMTIDVMSVEENVSHETPQSRKRKGAAELSPLLALFSPSKSIRTPSPGLKTRRASVLKQFETPEQQRTGSQTPQTEPASAKRVSTGRSQYTVSKAATSETDDEEDGLAGGLLDDSPEDDERACCDVKSVVEPILDAWHRTSSRFQNAWEEVRGLSSSLVLIPVETAPPTNHVADVRDDDLVVLEGGAGDEPNCVLKDPSGKVVDDGMLCVQTRRQRRSESRRRSAVFPWRLW